MSKKKQNYMLVLYDDDLSHVKAMKHIEMNYEYIKILHHKDIDEKTGELKKPHWHIVVRFENERGLKPFAKELNIDAEYISYVKTIKGALLYLVHKNDNTKAQYDVRELIGTPKMLERFETYNNASKTEIEKIMTIMLFIERTDRPISTRELTSYALNNGSWSELRRAYTIIRDLLREHNNRYY